MNTGIQHLPTFNIVGIGIKTTNEEGRAANDINKLWQRFYNESIIDQIPAKEGKEVYAVYWGYEGDHTKPYNLTIGCKTSAAEINESLEKVTIPAAQYASFAAHGEQPKALIETWETIWKSDLQRNFKTDIEVYGPRFFEPGIHEILVYVGVK